MSRGVFVIDNMIERHFIDLPYSKRASKVGAQRLRGVDLDESAEITITLAGPRLPAVAAMGIERVASGEMTAQYGSSAETRRTVEQVLREFGLAVRGVSAWGRSLRVSGTLRAMEAAFHPELGIYRAHGLDEFRGRAGRLKVPKALSGLVTGVFGLDQRRVARRNFLKSAQSRGAMALKPSSIERRYAFPAGAADGQVVAIAVFGAPIHRHHRQAAPAYIPDDTALFCAKHGRPMPAVHIRPVNLSPITRSELEQLPSSIKAVGLAESTELNTDLQIVAGLCPGALIRVYFASFDQKGWIDLLDAILDDESPPAVVVSISWGAPEDSSDWSIAALKEINLRLQAAAMRGISICVSSGDDGSGDGMAGSRGHIDFPAASPFVLSVGGTMVSKGQEIGWWQPPGQRSGGGGASGGGLSARFWRPPWQHTRIASMNAGGIDGRIVPDVAALAGPPMFGVIFNGNPLIRGGTSASAPVWASLIARIDALLPADRRQRFVTPLLYPAAVTTRAFREITVGHNASSPDPGRGYHCAPGFNAVTGLGVPNGRLLLKALAGTTAGIAARPTKLA